MTVQDSFIADIKRNENAYEIEKYIKRCKIFSDYGGVNEIGCRDKDKPYNNPRYS